MKIQLGVTLLALFTQTERILANVDHKIGMELVAEGLTSPLDLIFAPGDDSTRYIVEQHGFIYEMDENNIIDKDDPFLDISDIIVIQSAYDERGLLGAAFHPNYAETKKVYVQYSTDRNEANVCFGLDGMIPTEPEGCPYQHLRVVSEFTVVDGKVDRSTERRLFSLDWPNRSRNGGGLAFGGDGYLYIGLGDAGIIYGPEGRDDALTPVVENLFFGEHMAQDPTTYFGKILRIDVEPNGDQPYTVPSSNPFANRFEFPDFKSEIYAWGFRNPFRMSFDLEGDGRTFYVSASADTIFESTYKVTGPGNYGWGVREGSQCVVRSQPLNPPEMVQCTTDSDCPQGPQITMCGENGFCSCPNVDALGYPIQMPFIEYVNRAALEYEQLAVMVEKGMLEKPSGSASLGGHVYRGSAIPWLTGKFVQADFAVFFLDGLIYIASEEADSGWTMKKGYQFDAEDKSNNGFVKAIGRDGKGELYVITGDFTPDYSSQIGRIWKIVDATGDEVSTPAPASSSNAGMQPSRCVTWFSAIALGVVAWVAA